MEALHDVVKAGKARYIGASTMYAFGDDDVIANRRSPDRARSRKTRCILLCRQ
jgi:aryl-alcohol dehydrogenase-like predicted oxidoreductase